MARKKKGFPPTSNSTSSWQDLPQKLRQSIIRPATTWNLSYTVAAKSWITSPKRCNTIIAKSTPSLPQLHNSKDCESFEPHMFKYSFLKGACLLPSWDDNTFKHVALPNQCPIFNLSGPTEIIPTFMFYEQGKSNILPTTIMATLKTYKRDKYSWFSQDCAAIDTQSFNKRHMQLTSSVWFDGKCYALSLQGTLVAIENVGSHLVITRVSSRRAVPTVVSRNFRECLIELDGDIFLMFLISTKSASSVDNVEIFRLELEKLVFEKVESLGDRAVFVGPNHCLIVTAREVGCKGNCVYFTNRRVEGWWIYDMANGGISPCLSRSVSRSTRPSQYCWLHGKNYNYTTRYWPPKDQIPYY